MQTIWKLKKIKKKSVNNGPVPPPTGRCAVKHFLKIFFEPFPKGHEAGGRLCEEGGGGLAGDH